jgi:hypothetical protein
VALAARFNKSPPDRLDWAFTHDDSYRDPAGLPAVAALQSNLDTLRDLGIVKEKVEAGKYLDLSLVKEAALRLH